MHTFGSTPSTIRSCAVLICGMQRTPGNHNNHMSASKELLWHSRRVDDHPGPCQLVILPRFLELPCSWNWPVTQKARGTFDQHRHLPALTWSSRRPCTEDVLTDGSKAFRLSRVDHTEAVESKEAEGTCAQRVRGESMAWTDQIPDVDGANPSHFETTSACLTG